MMTDRERFVACITGQKLDRPPYWLAWGPWDTTWQRWRNEGATFENYSQVREHFGADCTPITIPVKNGPCPAFEYKVLEEDDYSSTWIDSWGIKRRNLKGQEGMSQFLEFPVKTAEDWQRYKAERLSLDHPDRLAGNWLAQCRDWMSRDLPLSFGSFPDVTLFGGIRWLLGDEECLLAFYTMPEVIADMMRHFTDLVLHLLARVVDAGVRVDQMHLWEDMSGRQGPLISPAHFRQFMTPNYARIHDFTRKAGIPVIAVDTDGNPDLIVPPMMEGGVNLLYPLEVAAGVDVNAFQAKYPTLGFMGGIDKRALAVSPAAIDRELARIAPAIRRGRYIPDLDHTVPDDVSWANFQHYAVQLKKLVGKA